MAKANLTNRERRLLFNRVCDMLGIPERSRRTSLGLAAGATNKISSDELALASTEARVATIKEIAAQMSLLFSNTSEAAEKWRPEGLDKSVREIICGGNTEEIERVLSALRSATGGTVFV